MSWMQCMPQTAVEITCHYIVVKPANAPHYTTARTQSTGKWSCSSGCAEFRACAAFKML